MACAWIVIVTSVRCMSRRAFATDGRKRHFTAWLASVCASRSAARCNTSGTGVRGVASVGTLAWGHGRRVALLRAAWRFRATHCIAHVSTRSTRVGRRAHIGRSTTGALRCSPAQFSISVHFTLSLALPFAVTVVCLVCVASSAGAGGSVEGSDGRAAFRRFLTGARTGRWLSTGWAGVVGSAGTFSLAFALPFPFALAASVTITFALAVVAHGCCSRVLLHSSPAAEDRIHAHDVGAVCCARGRGRGTGLPPAFARRCALLVHVCGGRMSQRRQRGAGRWR